MSVVCYYPLEDGRSCANHALDGHIYCVTHRRRPASAQPKVDPMDICQGCGQPWATLPTLHACPPPVALLDDAAVRPGPKWGYEPEGEHVTPDTDQDRSWEVLAARQAERALEWAVVSAAVDWRKALGDESVHFSKALILRVALINAVSILLRHREANRG